MAVLFIEPGTDATFDLKFYSSVTGTVTADAGQARTGPRSLKFDSGAGAALASVQIPTVPASGNGNLSFALRFATQPAGTVRIATISTTIAAFELTYSAGGQLHFTTGGSSVGVAGSSLGSGSWTHFAICYSIGTTTSNTVLLFLGTNSSADITLSNVTLAAASTPAITMGIVAGTPGANLVVNIDDVYVEDSGTLLNTGDIHVTAKRPISLYQGGFDSAIGANPSDRWTNVNERALSETNGWQQSSSLQMGRPISDITVTGWTIVGGGPGTTRAVARAPRRGDPGGRALLIGPGRTTLGGSLQRLGGGSVLLAPPSTAAAGAWQVTADVTADDEASYAVRAGTGTLEVLLSPLNAPGVTADHLIFCRLYCPDGSGAGEKATFSLVQGTTIIASSPDTTLSRSGYANMSLTLTAGQAAAITDYTDLRLRVAVDTAGAGEHVRVTQMYMQAPQATAFCRDETYQVEKQLDGDVDLTGASLKGRTAWGWLAKSAAAGTGEGLWADGVLSTSTFGTGPALVTVTDSLDKYPSADQGVGAHASNAAAATNLYECGYLLAYRPPSASVLYLRLRQPAATPPAGSQSAALPAGTFNSAVPFLDGVLWPRRGSSEVQQLAASLPQTAAQSTLLARFSSPALLAQTLTGGPWLLAVELVQESSNANARLAASLYVCRPSTAAIVGYVYDAATALGGAWAVTTAGGQAPSFSGASLAVLAGDFLVLEVWMTATQATATSYSSGFHFDGSQAVVATDSQANAASFLQSPASISFGVILEDA